MSARYPEALKKNPPEWCCVLNLGHVLGHQPDSGGPGDLFRIAAERMQLPTNGDRPVQPEVEPLLVITGVLSPLEAAVPSAGLLELSTTTMA